MQRRSPGEVNSKLLQSSIEHQSTDKQADADAEEEQ